MVNGSEFKQGVTVTGVRKGLKREFAFAMKTNSQILGSTLSRSHQNKNWIAVEPKRPINSTTCNNNIENGDVTMNNVSRHEEPTSDVVGVRRMSRSRIVENETTRIEKKRFPSNLKELLESRVLEGLHVKYLRKKKEATNGGKIFEGVITGDAIMCHCVDCTGKNEVMSPAKFERHAGSRNKKPPEYLFLMNETYNIRFIMDTFLNSSVDNMENAVNQILGGFMLQKSKFCLNCKRKYVVTVTTLFCKECQPSTHEASNSYVSLPPITIRDRKDAENNENASGIKNQKNIGGVTETEIEYGGCILCRVQDFDTAFGPRTVIICDQCEKEYHVECWEKHSMQKLEKLPADDWFCHSDCAQMRIALRNVVTCGEKPLSDSLLSLIQKKRHEKGVETELGLDIKWRVLNWEFMVSEEIQTLLLNAQSIFHEQFDPIVDIDTNTDFIHEMVFCGKIKEQYFGGMYTAVITINQMVVCAGIFRVFGTEMAELPIVATAANCQGQGYFQALFFCIESVLRSLKVKRLILPASKTALSIWTGKFGFTKLTKDEIKHYRSLYRLMMFHGTTLLKRPILPSL